VAISRYFKLVIYQTSKTQAVQKGAVFEAAKRAYARMGYTTVLLQASAKKSVLCEVLLNELITAGFDPKLSVGDLIGYMTQMGNECLFLEEREHFQCATKCAS
jgi:hypothetical protein